MEEIGHRIRRARKAKGWTLETLSEGSGLSSGFLSQVERGLTSLSIVSLSAICRALDVPMESMVSSNHPPEDPGSVITRCDAQIHLRVGTSPISYQYLSGQLPDSPIRELLIAEFPAGCAQEDAAHAGGEMGYVLRGRLTLSIGETTHQLTTGDSYCIEAHQPHGYATKGSGAAVLMAVSERFVEIPSTGAPRGRGKETA